MEKCNRAQTSPPGSLAWMTLVRQDLQNTIQEGCMQKYDHQATVRALSNLPSTSLNRKCSGSFSNIGAPLVKHF
jgi:hypothetical protein